MDSSYKIQTKESNLPDLVARNELVLVAQGQPRNGERLGKGKYHVTVNGEDGEHLPGQTLRVKEDEHGHLVCGLEGPDGTMTPFSPEEMEDLSFVFVPTQVVV